MSRFDRFMITLLVELSGVHLEFGTLKSVFQYFIIILTSILISTLWNMAVKEKSA